MADCIDDIPPIIYYTAQVNKRQKLFTKLVKQKVNRHIYEYN